MKARLVDYYKGRLTVELDEDFSRQFHKLTGMDVEITIKKHFPKRSLDANAYAWVLIREIAENRHEEPVQVYRRYIRDVAGKVTVSCVKNEDLETEVRQFLDGHIGRLVDIGESKIPGCSVIHKHYGSSDYDSQQMATLLDSIIEDCRLFGIETKTKEEIKSLLEEEKNA